MAVDIQGAVAVVTGGAQRIGKAIVLALAEAGCHVVINYRTSVADAQVTAEAARAALTERNNALTKTLKTRETGLARAEEKIGALTERNGHLEADVQISRTNIEKRVEDLNSSLQRERMERAVVEGALEAARKDNSRLQSEVAALRSTLRRGLPLDEAQLAPNEPESEESPAKSKKGKGAEPAMIGKA